MATEKFLYIESSQIPLKEIPYGDLKANMIDPTTGSIYKGIVLQGCFADLSNNNPNNNKRFYDIPTYLEFVKLLRKQIHSAKGVYGELEHPESYAVNFKNASHKLIDIWYEEETQLIMGVVLLLNTTNGKIAQEIVRSGGQLAISARAAGDEVLQPDGTKNCKVKLLTTYDLVYHPGFSKSVLEFKQLNESQQFLQQAADSKIGFNGIVYEKDLKLVGNKFMQYLSLNEKQNCFYEWFLKDLSENEEITIEDKEKDKIDEEIITDNESSSTNELEKQLELAAKKDLKENFFQQVQNSQLNLKKKSEGKSFYQGSAGFISTPYSN